MEIWSKLEKRDKIGNNLWTKLDSVKKLDNMKNDTQSWTKLDQN